MLLAKICSETVQNAKYRSKEVPTSASFCLIHLLILPHPMTALPCIYPATYLRVALPLPQCCKKSTITIPHEK